MKVGQRINDWELLFRASVTGLLLCDNGASLAICMLPAYINRRPAECEIVKDVVKLQTLNEAFELLRTLDTPINKYEALQKLCRADWIPGVQIDLVFSRSPAYQLVLLRVCAHMGVCVCVCVCVCAHACVR